MTSIRKPAPVWVMGLGNAVFGLVGGFIVLPLPQLLAAQGVSEARIAAISAACFSPGFWVFLLGPMLDLRFTRRAWATLFALLAGLAMTSAILLRTHLFALEAAVMVAYSAATMSSNALGGWLSSLIPADDEGGRYEARVSAWTQVAVFLGNGAMAILAGELFRRTPLPVTALVLGIVTASPALCFLFIPVPADERRLPWRHAGATFREFGRQIHALLRHRSLWITLALFILPTGSFALTNLLGGVVADFHATPAFASRIGGLVLTVAGAGSALLVPLFAGRIKPLKLYLGIGIAGSLLTLALLFIPRTPATFAFGFLSENVFQAMSFTAAVAITLAVIGRNNPLAGTTFGLLTGVTVLPILAMGLIDGRAYTRHSLNGMLFLDGALGLLACTLMSALMLRQSSRFKR